MKEKPKQDVIELIGEDYNPKKEVVKLKLIKLAFKREEGKKRND